MITKIIHMSVQNSARPPRPPRFWEMNTETLTQYLFILSGAKIFKSGTRRHRPSTFGKIFVKIGKAVELFSSLKIEGVVQISIFLLKASQPITYNIQVQCKILCIHYIHCIFIHCIRIHCPASIFVHFHCSYKWKCSL